jgi:hypothetical protein
MSVTALDSARRYLRQSTQCQSTPRTKARLQARRTHERNHATMRSVVPLLGAPQIGQPPSIRARSLLSRLPAGLCPFRSVVRQARPSVVQAQEAPTTSRLGRCTRQPSGTTQPPLPSPWRPATRLPELAPRMDQGGASTGDRPAGRTEPACPAMPRCKPRRHRRKSARFSLVGELQKAAAHV